MVMAYIYMILGDYDNALDEVDTLLSIPSFYSIRWIQLDPIWAPVQDLPRFKALVEKYGEKYGT